MTTECFCQYCWELVGADGAVEITDPWGGVVGYAHPKCADNYEPPDHDGEPPPTMRERQLTDWHARADAEARAIMSAIVRKP